MSARGAPKVSLKSSATLWLDGVRLSDSSPRQRTSYAILSNAVAAHLGRLRRWSPI